MPPRSKSSKVDWINCTLCHRLFSSKDQSIHNEECNDDKAYSSLLSHAFVQGITLNAIVSSIDGPIEKIPSQYHDCIVYIHPSAMKLCSIPFGGPVIVDSRFVLFAWPGAGLPLAGVSVPAAVQLKHGYFVCGEKLVITAMTGVPLHAASVCLKPQSIQEFSSSIEFSAFIKRQESGKFIKEGSVVSFSYFGHPCSLTVTQVSGVSPEEGLVPQFTPLPVLNLTKDLEDLEIDRKQKKRKKKSGPSQCFYKITNATQVAVIVDNKETKAYQGKPRVTLDSVGGLKKQMSQITELVQLHMRRRSAHSGVTLPKGVLLYGPSGTGKSLLMDAVVADSDMHVLRLHAAEVWSKFYGESEAKLTAVFREAKERAPSVILINDIDSLCPRKESSEGDVKQRVTAALFSNLDDVFSHTLPVMVLASVNNPDDLHQSMRRPGRLDREIEVGVPTAQDRCDILQTLLAPMKHSLSRSDIEAVAGKAHGFVGADLAAVCKEASIQAFKKSSGETVLIAVEDIATGLQKVSPSAMREVALEVPQVSWSDIGGQADLKHKLRQAIEWPLLHPQSFARLGIRPPKGLLMYGPPGCSKTMIAKALAKESGINFIAIKGPELFSKWVGESERAVRDLFRKARAAAPAIIFFDEIDALAGERGSGSSGGGEVSDRVLAQLLTEIDGVDALQDVTIVAATNRPDRIDKALLRPGRLDRIVYVPLPDAATRQEILTIQFRKTPTGEDVDMKSLVSQTEGYSGAEVAAVCHEAALSAMQENLDIPCVSARHFCAALKTVTPRITRDLIKFYNEYHEKSGLHSI